MHRIRIAAVVAIAGLLASCGGGDDEVATATTVPATTDAPATTGGDTTVPATTGATATTEADTTATTEADTTATTAEDVVVGSLDEMPPECVAILTEMFQAIEPLVAGLDFGAMTMNELGEIQDEFVTASEPYEERMTEAGCDQYSLEGEDSDPTLTFEQLTALAEDEAPGLAGYFQFLSEQFEAAETPADVPADCDGAIAVIEGYLAQGMSMGDVPLAEMANVQGAITAIYSLCDQATIDEFMSRDDVITFMSSIG